MSVRTPPPPKGLLPYIFVQGLRVSGDCVTVATEIHASAMTPHLHMACNCKLSTLLQRKSICRRPYSVISEQQQ
jgi:hypothetical protein